MMKANALLMTMFAAAALVCSCAEKEYPDHEIIFPDAIRPVTPEIDAKYAAIKDIASEYQPGMTMGLFGVSLQSYQDETYRNLANQNFQMFGMGNAMKNASVVKADGAMDFSEIDGFLSALPEGKQVYGHTLLWHNQQSQTYLQSLIAPTPVSKTTNVQATAASAYHKYNWIDEESSTFKNKTVGKWKSRGANAPTLGVSETGGEDGSACASFVNPVDAPGKQWNAAMFYDFPDAAFKTGDVYIMRFKVKPDGAGKLMTIHHQNTTVAQVQGSFQEYPLTEGWNAIDYEMTIGYNKPELVNDTNLSNRIVICFGKTKGTFLLDDIEFFKKGDDENVGPEPDPDKNFILKTPEEKRAALLGEMERWIKAMAQHPGMDKVVAWDVINEPVGDNGAWRGFDGTFVKEDKTPVENETDGLQLNWEAGHFFWGTFIGKDYGCKAFEFAKKYAREGTKLFVNDYGLVNLAKTDALINFVKYIDENNATGQPIVDGIGTQMHVSVNNTRAEFDEMFKKLAATGKLIRITEMDVKVFTTEPNPYQQSMQANVFKQAVESYIKNVPEAQRSGISVAGIKDNPGGTWLGEDAPCLWTKDYARKPAYYSFCDALAGKDLSK